MFSRQKSKPPRRMTDAEAIPTEFARALDESAEDLRQGRTEEVNAFIVRMEAKLQNHLARKP